MEYSLSLLTLGRSLKEWPRIKKFVESCRSGETVKKASVFEYEDLMKFVTNEALQTKYWQICKVVVAFAFFGGHRNCELRHLNRDSLSFCEDGIEVDFPRAKQQHEIKVFLIMWIT